MSNYAIYQPKGKAGEYAEWACNFHVGCSNDCSYCYCKKGVLAHAMGGKTATLKKCFKDENDALEVFEKELKANLPELQKHGLFFTFTSDPFLPETTLLTQQAARLCLIHDVPVKFLTKRTDWHIDEFIRKVHENGTIWNYKPKMHLLAFGFTLTGHDELEPGASANAERIEAMKKLHNAGFKTFASIEPIVRLGSSFEMICATNGFCDQYKIGLESGKKYNKSELNRFIRGVIEQVEFYGAKIYFKDSLLKAAGIERSYLPSNCVSRDFDIFNYLKP